MRAPGFSSDILRRGYFNDLSTARLRVVRGMNESFVFKKDLFFFARTEERKLSIYNYRSVEYTARFRSISKASRETFLLS